MPKFIKFRNPQEQGFWPGGLISMKVACYESPTATDVLTGGLATIMPSLQRGQAYLGHSSPPSRAALVFVAPQFFKKFIPKF
jgi:hypothetical protein